MTEQNAERFFRLLGEDRTVRTKYNEILGKYRDTGIEGGERTDHVRRDIESLAAGLGYEFSFDQLQRASHQALSEEQLSNIIGGVNEEKGACPHFFQYRGILCISVNCVKIGDCPMSQYYY